MHHKLSVIFSRQDFEEGFCQGVVVAFQQSEDFFAAVEAGPRCVFVKDVVQERQDFLFELVDGVREKPQADFVDIVAGHEGCFVVLVGCQVGEQMEHFHVDCLSLLHGDHFDPEAENPLVGLL